MSHFTYNEQRMSGLQGDSFWGRIGCLKSSVMSLRYSKISRTQLHRLQNSAVWVLQPGGLSPATFLTVYTLFHIPLAKKAASITDCLDV